MDEPLFFGTIEQDMAVFTSSTLTLQLSTEASGTSVTTTTKLAAPPRPLDTVLTPVTDVEFRENVNELPSEGLSAPTTALDPLADGENALAKLYTALPDPSRGVIVQVIDDRTPSVDESHTTLAFVGATVTVRFAKLPPPLTLTRPDDPPDALYCHTSELPYDTAGTNTAVPPTPDTTRLKSLVRAYTVDPDSFGTSVQFTDAPSAIDDTGHDKEPPSGVAATGQGA
jgi:hypothetical protein